MASCGSATPVITATTPSSIPSDLVLIKSRVIPGLVVANDRRHLEMVEREINECYDYLRRPIPEEDIIRDPNLLWELYIKVRNFKSNDDENKQWEQHSRHVKGTTLDITGHTIIDLPDDLFTHLPHIRRIFCKNNLLTTLPKSIADLSHLCVIMFQDNPIKYNYVPQRDDDELESNYAKYALYRYDDELESNYAKHIQTWIREDFNQPPVTKSAGKR